MQKKDNNNITTHNYGKLRVVLFVTHRFIDMCSGNAQLYSGEYNIIINQNKLIQTINGDYGPDLFQKILPILREKSYTKFKHDK